MSKIWIYIVGALVGGILGWTYWNFVGCDENCAIWSSPTNSTAYGVFLGAFALKAIKDLVKP
ncbi:MAG: hypothetical protein JKY52_11090 [Flavobacteriales bacterium]|nr:hypothetical protein [Flavobacteriales bacterium]